MSTADLWLDALGRLHPVFLHFPLALAVAAAMVEVVAWLAGRRAPASSAFVMVLLAAAFAPLASVSGWFNAEFSGDSGDLIFAHRMTGIASTALLLVVAAVAVAARRRSEAGRVGIVYRLLLLLTAGVIAWCGHLGGELKWGDGYTTKRLIQAIRATLGMGEDGSTQERRRSGAAEGARSSAAGGGTGAEGTTVVVFDLDDDALRYEEHIVPLFVTQCAECHLGGRSKGQLALGRHSDVVRMNRDDLWVVKPGSAQESELLRRLILPADDPDRMPPEGPPLGEREIELVRRWIDAGAR